MSAPDTSLKAQIDASAPIRELSLRLAEKQAWLVGGAVRDLLLGREPVDLDVAVESDVAGAAARIGAEPIVHERFGTATAYLGPLRVDLASTRAETYERPGALPTVAPASLAEDLARRDFAINAMAVPLDGEALLLDAHDGLRDLDRGVVRVLHPGSITDDPTRALRAALYAARLGFSLDDETEAQVRGADLGTVSAERVEADLARIVEDEAADSALGLLADWGLAGIDHDAARRVAAAKELVAQPRWENIANRREVLLDAARPSPALAESASLLAAASPERASQVAAEASGRSGRELLAARIAGAAWLDRWVGDLDQVRLEIDGDDLLSAGVPAGPSIGRGLAAALDARLDGEAPDRDAQLRVAIGEAT